MIPETIRPQVRAGMIAQGVPADLADRATDLAIHAVNQALATFDRCTQHLDGAEWSLAYQVGSQVLSAHAQAMFAQFKELADKEGVASGVFAISSHPAMSGADR